MIDALRSSAIVDTVPMSSRLFAQALALDRARGDKAWGITDCASFVVMEERNPISALTTDDHVRQAGFRALLLERDARVTYGSASSSSAATATTAHGVARVDAAFARRDGRATHHLAGIHSFAPHLGRGRDGGGDHHAIGLGCGRGGGRCRLTPPSRFGHHARRRARLAGPGARRR